MISLSAIPIIAPDAALFALAERLAQGLRTGESGLQHLLPRTGWSDLLEGRIRANSGNWIPVTDDELAYAEQLVVELDYRSTGKVAMARHLESAVSRGWIGASEPQPAVGVGAGMRWSSQADPDAANQRACRRIRGDADPQAEAAEAVVTVTDRLRQAAQRNGDTAALDMLERARRTRQRRRK